MKYHRMHGFGVFKKFNKVIFKGRFENGQQLGNDKKPRVYLDDISVNTKSTDA